MQVDQLIKKLEAQIAALKGEVEGGYRPHAFQVWYVPYRIECAIGDALIREERRTWSWGFCRSDTCNHNSHDPHCTGNTAYIVCRAAGKDEQQHPIYSTPDGVLFKYEYVNNGHYAPTASISLVVGAQ